MINKRESCNPDIKYWCCFLQDQVSLGFWQVPLDPACKEYTAFQIPGLGLFHYTVLPFWLHGAPVTFQRLMAIVLQDCSRFAAAYLDYVVIYSENWEDHLQHVKTVLWEKVLLGSRGGEILGLLNWEGTDQTTGGEDEGREDDLETWNQEATEVIPGTDWVV